MITLPTLNFEYNALEPYIDQETMRIHYTKHHQAYIDKLNLVLDKYPELQSESIETLLGKLESLRMDPKDRVLLKNHGGGHVNHAFFWTILGVKKAIDHNLLNRITTTYGSFEEFKKQFTDTALSHFGSGWMWLVENKEKKLEMYSTPNQDSPYLSGSKPILALDLWEHAYYLKYQNRKADYITAWWKVVKIL